MIGARDMVFPLLNLMSFWTMFVSTGVLVASFFVPMGAAAVTGADRFRSPEWTWQASAPPPDATAPRC